MHIMPNVNAAERSEIYWMETDHWMDYDRWFRDEAIPKARSLEQEMRKKGYFSEEICKMAARRAMATMLVQSSNVAGAKTSDTYDNIKSLIHKMGNKCGRRYRKPLKWAT